MTSHKFAIGQLVCLRHVRVVSERSKTYVITQWMPIEHGVVTYRIRSQLNECDRIAEELELSSADEDDRWSRRGPFETRFRRRAPRHGCLLPSRQAGRALLPAKPETA